MIIEKQDRPVVIKIENVSKTFSIRSKKVETIRDRFFHLFSKDDNRTQKVKALVDINLDIYKGEFLGIIGHNGSGKSTLLKLIMGAFPADKGGKIEVQGKIIRLALGMGFDPTLTARDNIYVNGTVLGLTFKQLGQKFGSILEFAELEKFVDTPLKFFSSGMRSRLAFAIAMHTEADIYLMDEFFGGVGDVGFMEKSEEVFKDRILEGRTIIHVSHQLRIIQRHSDRVVWLDQGKIKAIGTAEEILPDYRAEFIKRNKDRRDKQKALEYLNDIE
jgi:ABC-2 type transport system ATP-binding protein